MRVASRLICRTEWSEWLKHFADLVSDKEYDKLNYNHWKTLSKPVSEYIAIELSNGTAAPIITIASGAHNPIVLYAFDESLGSFLFENLFNDEERQMSYLNDVSCSSVNALSSSDAAKLATAVDVSGCTIGYDGSYYSTNTTAIDGTGWLSVTDRTSELADKIDQRPTFNDVNKMIDDKMKKGNEEMKGFNFDFGPCTSDQVRMSMYGMAVKNAAGTYVSYNPKTQEIVDVDVLNFDGAKYMYKIPVAVKDVAVGDIIIHNRKPMFVTALATEGSNAITCVDVCAGEQKMVIPTVNMFGFNFITKIVSLFNTLGDNAPTPDAPFGNMLPLMLMGGNDEKIDPMMLMCMMQGNVNMACNPMMLYLMTQDNKDMDPMKWMVLSMMTNSAPAFMTGNYPKQQA